MQPNGIALLLFVVSIGSAILVSAHRRKDLRFLDSFGDIRTCDTAFDGLDNNFADGVTVISGLCVGADIVGAFVIGDTDLDRSEFGDVEGLLQFFNHKSGVISPPGKKIIDIKHHQYLSKRKLIKRTIICTSFIL